MYDNREDIYWMWLKSVEGVGAASFNRLLQTHGTPKNVFNAIKDQPESLTYLSLDVLRAMRQKADRSILERMVDVLEKYQIRILTRNNPQFPILLSQIHNPPPILFVRGQNVDFNSLFCISMVGTRRCSNYGRGIAQSFAKHLALNKVTVVSGMALGIDADAHEGALSSRMENSTIAVMASGLEKAYPATNAVLFERILQRGCAISENVPGTKPTPSSFPIRNRMIAGLSRGVLVVEGMKRSGTRFTVDFALDAGRDVFAIPGRISDIASEYPLEIIKLGAKLVTSPQEILQEYSLEKEEPKFSNEALSSQSRVVTRKVEQSHPKIQVAAYSELSQQEKTLVEILMKGDCSADELFEMTLIPMNKLLSTITGLIQKQVIVKSVTGIFSIKSSF